MMYVPTNVVVSRTKHSKTKTEARSTQISKTKHPRFKTKHPNLENEAPKTRKRSTLDRKRSTQISKTKTPKLENEAPESGGGSGCVRSSKGPQNPSQGFIRACQLFNWTFLDRIYCITAVITNARLQRVFPSVQTCVLVDVNQSLPWFFTRWPREDSFSVSWALGRICRRFSRFCNILLQDLTPLHVKITRRKNLLSVFRRKLKLSTYLHTLSYNHISFLNRSEFLLVLVSIR